MKKLLILSAMFWVTSVNADVFECTVGAVLYSATGSEIEVSDCRDSDGNERKQIFKVKNITPHMVEGTVNLAAQFQGRRVLIYANGLRQVSSSDGAEILTDVYGIQIPVSQ